MTIKEFPGRQISIEEKNYLYFGGTSYLGLATNDKFQNLLFQNIKKWGTAYGSSRNANVELSVFEKVEELLANCIGAQKALTVSSGTLAGKLVLDYLELKCQRFYHHPKTHPAIIHRDSKVLYEGNKLRNELKSEHNESIVITVDAVRSSEVHTTDFSFLNEIAPSKSVVLLVDESHSIGLMGYENFGIFRDIDHPLVSKKIMVASLSKAFGCVGGVIASDSDFIGTLRQNSIFIGSSAMNPSYLGAFCESQELIKFQRKQLKKNLDYFFEDLVLDEKFNFNVNYPVIYCDDPNVFEHLKSQGILITNFKYPNYDVVMNRIVITANHTFEDLSRLKTALLGFKR